jgi:hypothetical protein
LVLRGPKVHKERSVSRVLKGHKACQAILVLLALQALLDLLG